MNSENIQLPEEYLKLMRDSLGEYYDDYIDSLNSPAVKGLRVNTNKISIDDFSKLIDFEIEKLPFCNDGFKYVGDKKLGNTYEHLSGLFYIQEPSSMLAVVSSDIENDHRPLKVLDLCASPGGKTSQIATRISSDSLLISNEIVKSRADVLFSNVERQGFKNVIILNEEPKNLLKFEGYFDYVFVDAPCSGEGMFRKNPETINEWSEQNVTFCSKRQREILDIAQRLVKTDGKLIYSTCTFSKQEDEEIVDWVLENYNCDLEDIPDSIKKVTFSSKCKSDDREKARKFYPFTGDGEGQFVSVFKNKNKIEDTLYTKKHLKNIGFISSGNYVLLKEFLIKNMSIVFDKRDIVCLGNTFYLVPKQFDDKLMTALDDLRIINIGVNLGNVVNNRFIPSHNLFMAMGEYFIQKIELDNISLNKYLHGDELTISGYKNGYAVIAKNNFALGGVKVTNNKLKNLYPKGLRIW